MCMCVCVCVRALEGAYAVVVWLLTSASLRLRYEAICYFNRCLPERGGRVSECVLISMLTALATRPRFSEKLFLAGGMVVCLCLIVCVCRWFESRYVCVYCFLLFVVVICALFFGDGCSWQTLSCVLRSTPLRKRACVASLTWDERKGRKPTADRCATCRSLCDNVQALSTRKMMYWLLLLHC